MYWQSISVAQILRTCQRQPLQHVHGDYCYYPKNHLLLIRDCENVEAIKSSDSLNQPMSFVDGYLSVLLPTPAVGLIGCAPIHSICA